MKRAATPAQVVTLDCPITCLQLSTRVYNRLTHAYRASFDPPKTVRDVLTLIQRHQLDDMWGLGPRSIAEVEVSLVAAGFVIDAHHHQENHT